MIISHMHSSESISSVSSSASTPVNRKEGCAYSLRRRLYRLFTNKVQYLWIFTRILCPSVDTGMEVLCNAMSCLLLWTSHTSSISAKELVVHTARRWSCDQESGCTPLTGAMRGTTGSRLTGTSSAPKTSPPSFAGSVFMTTFLGIESFGSGGLAADMFSVGWK